MKNVTKLGKITTEESEICNILLEEASEVVQAVSKVFRFGWDSCHPDKPNFTNKEHLTEELGDLVCMIKILCDKEIVSLADVSRYAEYKQKKLKIYSDIKL
jgi:NTP pyrophosphatase (non-canonical NTP hydrolase)